MASGDFTLYQDEFYGGFIDVVMQNLDAFNAASNNAFVLETDFHEGNYQKEAFFDRISSLVARRDSASASAVSDLSLTSDEFVRVKLDRRVGPVLQTRDQWRKIGKDIGSMSFVVGQQSGLAMLQEILNRGLAAAEAKLDSVAALEHDRTAGTMRTEDLVDGLYKFGDNVSSIACWFMHSAVAADLLKDQIADAVYRGPNTQVLEGSAVTLGRPVVITDSASLISYTDVSSGAPVYSTLGLAAGGVMAKFSQPEDAVLDLVTGVQNISYRYQAEYSYTLGLRGCTWDVTNGGANPTDAAVATATNWDTQVTETKSLPGVIIRSS